ncbi:hypothetical protein L1987_34477 [Smallanthus sonchifolius]|uniref:Uncharacterized protein n=1 Tax=Smallanthus sonchifolius TaxID=185202 RepID=A0ACB9HUC1_9ASTR|nr:hypothetical protein L1987_34477 [Smallanthus sonchifolius]
MAAAVVAELDETKVVSSTTIDPPRVSNSNSNSLRDDCSEIFELGFRDNVIHPIGVEKEAKKPRSRGSSRGSSTVEVKKTTKIDARLYSESWQDCYNEVNSGFNMKVLRSNSSVSWRSSSLRKSNPNTIARREWR